jgi:glyoxylase-like metal-dependent hydrolase (beta-lactamase superfamily II)
LPHNLRACGISTDYVDRVIITHAHPAHIGGCLDNLGNLTFPRAHYTMGKDEWKFWREGDAEQQLPAQGKEEMIRCAARNLPPIRRQLELVDTETEILPGIRVIPAPGHTPGHLAVSVSSQDHTLMVIADTFLHPIHVEYPEWCASTDVNFEQTVATRTNLAVRAQMENALVFGSHLPFPGLGKIVPQGERNKWQPLLSYLQG